MFAGFYEYKGIINYIELLKSKIFWEDLLRTLIWTGGSIAIQIGGGLGCALILNQKFRGNNFVRSLILVPWLTSGVVIGVLWRWMLNDQYGVINDLLSKIGFSPVNWLALPSLALFSVIFVNGWKALPFTTISILAGLSSIPSEIYEAATIDGANTWHRFVHITIPGLKYILVTLLLLTTIWTMCFFDLIFVLTQGGPARSTEILPLLVYEYSFKNFQYGKGAACAILLAVINTLFVIFYLKLLPEEGK